MHCNKNRKIYALSDGLPTNTEFLSISITDYTGKSYQQCGKKWEKVVASGKICCNFTFVNSVQHGNVYRRI